MSSFLAITPSSAQAEPLWSKTLIGLLMLAGWGVLVLLLLDMIMRDVAGQAGPGMEVFSAIAPQTVSDWLGQPYKFSLCVTDEGGWALTDFGKSFLMWSAMILAMMSPLLWPSEKKPQATTRHNLSYIAAWLCAGVLGVTLHWILRTSGILNAYMVGSPALFNTSLLLAIGLYQFSPIKKRHLHLCRQPAGTKITTSSGFTAGLNCIKCCGPLMLTMFVFGLMNIFVVMILTLLMLAEQRSKQAETIAQAIGAGLILLGIAALF